MNVARALPLLWLPALLMTGMSAQAELDEIVVSAQKRTETLQDVPLAVSALGKDELEAYSIATMADLTETLPYLHAYEFPTTTNNLSLFMRGMGNPDSQTLTIDNPIGVYIDGVYIARTSGALLELLDLERVEILRGPQGTLYGRNSTAGAINFVTEKPSDEFAARVSLGAGNDALFNASATIEGALSDSVSGKLSVLTSSEDGWVSNAGPNPVSQPAKDFYMTDQQAFRVSLRWQASDKILVDYSYDDAEIDATPQHYQAIVPGTDLATVSRTESTSHVFLGGTPFRYVVPESPSESRGHNLTITADINDTLAFKSITAHRSISEAAVQNWSDVLFFATDLLVKADSLSQELQLLGTAADGAFEYIVGAYYYEENGEKAEEQFLNFNAAVPVLIQLDALAEPGVSSSLLVGGTSLGQFSFDADLRSIAVFAQATYAFTDQLEVTAGLRYTDDDRDALRAGVLAIDPNDPFDQCFGQPPGLPSNTTISFCSGVNQLSYSNTDVTLVADWAFSDDGSLYARYATGFRAGGSAERALNFAQTFDKETADTIELGFKSEVLEQRLRLNAALHRTVIDDFILTLNGPTPDTAAFVENFNVGEATVQGLELDVLALLGERTTLTLNYAYLDWNLEDLVVPADSFLLSGLIPGTVDQRGQDISSTTFIPQTPDNAYTLALDHSLPLSNDARLDIHVDYVYRDKVFSQPARGLPVDGLGLVNARITWSGIDIGNADLDIAIWSKNLLDADKVIYDLNNFGVQFARPTTYGVQATLNF
jgi:iron complex outermembrane receptor protein